MNALKVAKRDLSVKAKHLRRAGKVPGSVCGGPLPESISLEMNEAELRKALVDKREGSRMDLDLDGQIIPVQIKQKSVDVLKNDILNITFQALAAGHKVKSVAHILVENTEKITDTFEKLLTEVPYSSLPRDMVDTVTIDADGMQTGTVIMLKDIPELYNDKIELHADPEEIVFRIVEKKAAEEEAPAEAADAE